MVLIKNKFPVASIGNFYFAQTRFLLCVNTNRTIIFEIDSKQRNTIYDTIQQNISKRRRTPVGNN